MEQVCDYSICTGCGVCSSVCPKACISFVEGKKGHLYPKIDPKKCIDCKKCQRTCPALKTQTGIMPTVAYAAFTRNEYDYKTTTSGGAAQVLSQYILDKGGVVYGCAVMPGADVRHIRVTTSNELERLKGSKYVQSNLLDIFPLIKKDVKEGLTVLFIGVPCQVASIISLFGKKPDNLILVDLICHGVPSLASLQNYLNKHIGDLSKIQQLRFRTSSGFQIVASGLEQNFNRKKNIYESVPLAKSPYGDEYYTPFFYGFSYRPSCYKCQYAKPSRISDITIGDFWGLNNNELPSSFPNHQKGISVILPSTAKGNEMISQIKPFLHIAERPVEEAINGNKQLQHPTIRNFRIKIYEVLSPIIGIKEALKLTNIDMRLRRTLRPYIRKNRNIR